MLPCITLHSAVWCSKISFPVKRERYCREHMSFFCDILNSLLCVENLLTFYLGEYLLSLLKVQMPDPNFSGFLCIIENSKIRKSRENSTIFPLLLFNHLQQWTFIPQSHPQLSVFPLLPLHSPLLPVLQPPSHPCSSSSMVSKFPLLPSTYLVFFFAVFRTRLKDHQSVSGLAFLLPKITTPALALSLSITSFFLIHDICRYVSFFILLSLLLFNYSLFIN